MAIKKENLAEDSRSNPRSIPPEIVAPDLDIPGNSANNWKNPIQRASDQVEVVRDRLREPEISATSRNALVNKRKIAAAIGLLKACSKVSLNKIAATPAGIVARIRYQPRRA